MPKDSDQNSSLKQWSTQGRRYRPGECIAGRWFVHRTPRPTHMGVVYFCYDTAIGMPTVAKSLPPNKLANPSVHKRFLEECELWVSLEKHPYIVKALYVENIDSTPFIFTEWIVGPENCFESSLADFLRRHGRGSVDFVMKSALGICEAFAHLADRFGAMGQRFVHRDLKPGNVLLDDTLRVKVTDFGLAAVLYEATASLDSGSGQIHQLNEVCGTPPYMAPEQWRPSRAVDCRADIYAFGCVLFEMLAGRSVFDVSNRAGWQEAHEKRDPLPLQSFRSDIPRSLTHLIYACLEKDPRRRPQSFEEIRSVIGRISGTSKAARNHSGNDLGNGKAGTKSETGEKVMSPSDELKRRASELTNKGSSLDAMGKPQEALICYSEAESILEEIGDKPIPERFMLIWNRAIAFEHCGRFEEALRDWDRALSDVEVISLSPGYLRGSIPMKRSRVLGAKAKTLGAMGALDEAIKCCQEALELEPELEDALSAMIFALVKAERYEEAIQWCGRVLKSNPRDLHALTNKAVSLIALGQTEEGLQAVNEALTVSPQHPEALFTRGSLLLRRRQFEKAEHDLRLAVQFRPRYSEAWNHLGLVLLQAEKPGYRDCFLKALDADPYNKAAAKNLAGTDARGFVQRVLEVAHKGGGTIEFSPDMLSDIFLVAVGEHLDELRRFTGQDLWFIRNVLPDLSKVRELHPKSVAAVVKVERSGDSMSVSLQVGFVPPD